METAAFVKQLFEQTSFLDQPESLYEPIEYTMRLSGKRLRPQLLINAAVMFGGTPEAVAPAAVAIETFHNFTLLHDDLMDKAPLRRGNPTVHCKWNPNVAILSGDAMLVLAWKHLLQLQSDNLHDILTTFNDTAIGVMEGQQYDMDFESRHDVSIPEYIEMIRLKTAVLLAGALPTRPPRTSNASTVSATTSASPSSCRTTCLTPTATRRRWAKRQDRTSWTTKKHSCH